MKKFIVNVCNVLDKMNYYRHIDDVVCLIIFDFFYKLVI